MANQPGLSWGPAHPVNAMRTSRGWLLIDFSGPRPRIVATVPKSRGVFAKIEAVALGVKLNYGDKLLDAATLAEIDATP